MDICSERFLLCALGQCKASRELRRGSGQQSYGCHPTHPAAVCRPHATIAAQLRMGVQVSPEDASRYGSEAARHARVAIGMTCTKKREVCKIQIQFPSSYFC
eukprot:6214375-Pleurochrysis_carterae.AAC.3